MDNKIKIFIVDDHQIMIDGIMALLKNDERFEVIGQSVDPVAAIEKIKLLQPNVLITDIQMQEMNGVLLAKKIKSFLPQTKILALSMHNDRETISEMLGVGINGYVLKNTGKEELTQALINISENRSFYSDEVLNALKKHTVNESGPHKQLITLTPREKEIVKLISMEYNNAQISAQLFISERTVETHRKNIFRKTQTKSVAGLIKLAMEQKII